MKKESFLPGLNFKTAPKAHGGEHAKGRRKSARPIDPKQALHVVLRSTKAQGAQSMLQPKHCKHIHEFIQRTAKRLGVRVYRYANVGNHLHLLIKVPNRTIWQHFLREIAGGIAIIVTGAKKGLALLKNEQDRGFWDGLAFTRIVKFGRDFARVCDYVVKNLFESMGIPVKKLLAKGMQILSSDDGSLYQPFTHQSSA